MNKRDTEIKREGGEMSLILLAGSFYEKQNKGTIKSDLRASLRDQIATTLIEPRRLDRLATLTVRLPDRRVAGISGCRKKTSSTNTPQSRFKTGHHRKTGQKKKNSTDEVEKSVRYLCVGKNSLCARNHISGACFSLFTGAGLLYNKNRMVHTRTAVV